ncbi:DUF3397 domain-containing protein [Agrilactobacillus yilanensis]|uniref:DUF3397 domain-containing protein n=1 Tax=Agrilactobacillus yilanensis TaxID=2485997 RepID=A0ABW4J5A9_9LACO|nr:DUF3397 domain-containing protein [Agrilactobacillus yilanensis]
MKLISLGILIPMIGLIISMGLKKIFKNLTHVKTVDFLPPFLIAGVQLISLGHGQLSMIEVMILVILLMAIGLAIFSAIRDHELLLPRFFKTLWRLIFILSLCWYVGFIILVIGTQISNI